MAYNVKRRLNRLRDKLSGSDARFYAFAAFLTLVFFTGGSSRDDVQSLMLLRPIAIFFGAYALSCMSLGSWKGRTFPLSIALALVGLMVVQLIPLPPKVWTALPGRQIFADIADLAGIEQPWRPLTLSPSRTLNSLFSIAIPISAMMLYLNLSKADRKRAILVVIVLIGLSAMWGMLQLSESARGPFYLYSITNNGSAVGLFANRNHQAVLLTTAIVMLGWYGSSQAKHEDLAALKFYIAIAGIFVIVPLIFITGSRAGLILMAPALIATMLLIYFGRFTSENQRFVNSGGSGKKGLSFRQIILFGSIVLVVSIAFLSIYFSRSEAFDRLIGRTSVEELRVQLFPVLANMLSDHFTWGSGFGTFEYIYRIYEPKALLNGSYLNQAHIDWLQFPMEGGLPAIAIAGTALFWATKQAFVVLKNWSLSRYSKYGAIMAAMVMLLFLAASIGDYPLRVPSLIAVFAIMACIFGDEVRTVPQKTGNFKQGSAES